RRRRVAPITRVARPPWTFASVRGRPSASRRAASESPAISIACRPLRHRRIPSGPADDRNRTWGPAFGRMPDEARAPLVGDGAAALRECRPHRPVVPALRRHLLSLSGLATMTERQIITSEHLIYNFNPDIAAKWW